MDHVCQQLRRSATYIRHWLQRQPCVKEESLTDWLLYDVSRRLPCIYYHAFTRHEEARDTGADWEWWFLFDTRYLRMRVQAKKLYTAHDNYPGLSRTNRYGLQIDMLLNDAKAANAIPLYAFYSTVDSPLMCGGGQHEDGVFLAGAQRIFDSFIAPARQVVTPQALLTLSNPFSCFACCPLVHADGMSRFLQHYYASELTPAVDGSDTPRGVHQQLPGYMASLVEHARDGIPDWWEREFQFDLREFRAILVYDLRHERA